MKKFKSIILTVALSLVFFACEQEVTELKPNPYSPSSPTGQSGSGTTVLYWTVPMDAPATLYYQCTLHAAMNGTINVA